MTIRRHLVFTGLVAVVLAIAIRHLAAGCFAASILPAVVAIPYALRIARSHKTAALATAAFALLPIYISSMGPLNAVLAARDYGGCTTSPVVYRAIDIVYKPLQGLPWRASWATSFDRYLGDWSKIGTSCARALSVLEIDPMTGLPVSDRL